VLTNERGRILEEFVISIRIHIVNENNKFTRFESNRVTRNVDLKTANNIMETLLIK